MSDQINYNSETDEELGINDEDSESEYRELIIDESIIRTGYLKKKGQQRKVH